MKNELYSLIGYGAFFNKKVYDLDRKTISHSTIINRHALSYQLGPRRVSCSATRMPYSSETHGQRDVVQLRGFDFTSRRGELSRFRIGTMAALFYVIMGFILPVIAQGETVVAYNLRAIQYIEALFQVFTLVENTLMSPRDLKDVREVLITLPVLNGIRSVTGTPNTDYQTDNRLGTANVSVQFRDRQWDAVPVCLVVYIIGSLLAYDQEFREEFNFRSNAQTKVPRFFNEVTAAHGVTTSGRYRIENIFAGLPQDFLAATGTNNSILDVVWLRTPPGIRSVLDLLVILSTNETLGKYFSFEPYASHAWNRGMEAQGDMYVALPGSKVDISGKGPVTVDVPKGSSKTSDGNDKFLEAGEPLILTRTVVRCSQDFSRTAFVPNAIVILPVPNDVVVTHTAHLVDTFVWQNGLQTVADPPVAVVPDELFAFERHVVDASSQAIAHVVCLRVIQAVHNQVPTVTSAMASTSDDLTSVDEANPKRARSKGNGSRPAGGNTGRPSNNRPKPS